MAQTYSITAQDPSLGASPLQALHAAIRSLVPDDEGQDLVEYALVASFMGLASVAGVNGLAAKISNDLNIVLTGFNAALFGHV